MSEWMQHGNTELSTTFDNDFGNNGLDSSVHSEVVPHDYAGNTFTGYNHDVLNYQDPLKYSHKYQFHPLDLNIGNVHHVDPHHVDGYMRKDGTYVEPYYRDGDGNPLTNLTTEQGGGYLRTDPDGNPFNNLE